LFRSMDRCFATLSAWNARAVRRSAGAAAGNGERRSLQRAGQQTLADIAAATGPMTEREAKAVLAAYGVPVVEEKLVATAGEAVAMAAEIGFPVALKIESVDLPHKTEAKVIRLNLRTPEEVEEAYASVMANARKVVDPSRIAGVLIQPMIPPGLEIMVGARIDPMFGPMIVVGLGGIFVELFKDIVIALAPVTLAEAKTMLQRLKGAALLQGFRGAAPIDLDRLADVVCRVSELAADHRERIDEIDINPIICSDECIVAVDALIIPHVGRASLSCRAKGSRGILHKRLAGEFRE